MSASEPLPTEPGQAQGAGRHVLIICGVLAAMVLVIVVARLASGGSIALLSLALPVLGLCWLAGIGLRVSRFAASSEAAAPRSERPSRRLRHYDPSLGPRSDRPSDAGRHVSV